ncbi:hypothetical protein WB391_20735 [Lusitaniella coriacea LEGE 07167]
MKDSTCTTLTPSKSNSGIIVTPQNNAYEIAKRVGIIADEIFNQLLYA